MQEYFNLDIENYFNLKSPQDIKSKNGESAILSASYNDDSGYSDGLITIMTPPLRCSNVRVWPGKNDKYSKCFIELEITENEYRFTKFLKNLSNRCRYLITENANNWFKYTYSASAMRESYFNLLVKKIYKNNEPRNIQLQLGKNLLNDLDKHVAKSYRNQYLVLRIVFKGIVISNGSYKEVWRADQIYKAKPISYYSDETDCNDSEYEDIGETIPIKHNDVVNTPENKTTLDKQIKDIETKLEKLGSNEQILTNSTNLETDTTIKNIVTVPKETFPKETVSKETVPKETVNLQLNNNEDSKVKQLESGSEARKKQQKNKKIIMSNNRKRNW
jgi:hypothetical protein